MLGPRDARHKHMMWTDQEAEPDYFEVEGDPTLAHFAVVMYLLAAAAATLVTIFIVIRSPMHY